MSTTKLNAMVFSAVLSNANKVILIQDAAGFYMHALVSGNKLVAASHINVLQALQGTSIVMPTKKQSKSALLDCACPGKLIKAFPSQALELGFRLLDYKTDDVISYITNNLVTLNNKDCNDIKVEVLSTASFGTIIDYSTEDYYANLAPIMQGNKREDFEPHIGKDFLLCDAIKAGKMFQKVYTYVTYEHPGTTFKNLLLHGDPGAGKTTLAECLAYVLAMPYALLPAHEGLQADDISGYTVSKPINGQPHFEDVFTLFLLVAVAGGVIVIDEADVLPISLQKLLNNFLWGDGVIVYKGKTYRRHPRTIVILTCNTGLAGDLPFLNAFETRLRPFLVPALTLEERANYWYRLFDTNVSMLYLEEYIMMCDTIREGLNGPDVQAHDDRHPDGTAFNSRAHLTMLSEWLNAKDTVQLPDFLTDFIADYVGNIRDAALHVDAIITSINNHILTLESLAATAFQSSTQMDMDEGITDEERAALLEEITTLMSQAEVECKSEVTDTGYTFTITGGAYGTATLEYNTDEGEFKPADGTVLSEDLFNAAVELCVAAMEAGSEEPAPEPVADASGDIRTTTITSTLDILSELLKG